MTTLKDGECDEINDHCHSDHTPLATWYLLVKHLLVRTHKENILVLTTFAQILKSRWLLEGANMPISQLLKRQIWFVSNL